MVSLVEGSVSLETETENRFLKPGETATFNRKTLTLKVEKDDVHFAMRDKDLSFILNYAAGGDSLSRGAEQTVNDFLAAHGARYPIAKGYGMTEVSSAATVAAGADNKPGSVGIPMVNTIIAAFEPGTDRELPIGERGELCISCLLYTSRCV